MRPLATSSSTAASAPLRRVTSRSSRPIARAGEQRARARRRRAGCPRRPRSRSPAARRADPFERLLGAAVMAAQRARARVHREPRVAARALRASCTRAERARARSRGGSGTAAPGCRPRDARRSRRPAASRRLAARVRVQVDDPHARHARASRSAAATRACDSGPARAFAKLSSDGVAEPSTTGTLESLRAHDREIARRVSEAALLLVRSVVLLVDDRSGRPRAAARTPPTACRRRARASLRARAPRFEALALRERGVQQRERRRRSARAKRATSCGVSPISGTSSSVCRSAASSAAIRRR